MNEFLMTCTEKLFVFAQNFIKMFENDKKNTKFCISVVFDKLRTIQQTHAYFL